VFTGFNLTFFILHLTGLLGMPRRVYTYAEGLGWEVPNLVSSIGSFILAIGFALVLLDMLMQWRFAPQTRRNSWNAGTLEWAMATPVTAYNFASLPEVNARDPLWQDDDLPAQLASGEGYLAGATRPGQRETLAVRALDGRPDHLIILPGPSYVPLVAALALVGAAGCFLLKFYAGSALFAAGLVAACLHWLWQSGLRNDPQPVAIGRGVTVLPHAAADQPPGWWGMVFTLIFDATLLTSLVFGYLFLLTVAPNWPPPAFVDPDLAVASLAAAGLAATWLGADGAVRANRLGQDRLRLWLLLIAGAGGVAAASGFALIALMLAPPASGHAYAACVLVLAMFGGLHAGLSAIGGGLVAARCRAGFVSRIRANDLLILRLWCRFTAGAGAIVLLAIYLVPWLAGG
jgi:cytochrome c oxidase subunit I+III